MSGDGSRLRASAERRAFAPARTLAALVRRLRARTAKTVPRLAGGIAFARDKPGLEREIVDVPPPPELVLPLVAHRGRTLEARVRVGQRVARGETLAPGLLAGTDGTVVAIEPRPIAHPSGREVPCIVVATDTGARGGGGSASPGTRPEATADATAPGSAHEPLRPTLPPLDAPSVERLIACGVTGLGGAGFPTVGKLADAAAHPLHTLVVNGAECEPGIACDEALMREAADEIVAGAVSLATLAGCERCLLVVESDKREALAALRAALADHERTTVDASVASPTPLSSVPPPSELSRSDSSSSGSSRPVPPAPGSPRSSSPSRAALAPHERTTTRTAMPTCGSAAPLPPAPDSPRSSRPTRGVEPAVEAPTAESPHDAPTVPRLLAIPPVYPSGAERLLIRLATGIDVPPDKRPSRHGVLCVNVATARAAHRARLGEPMLSRVVTVAGAGVRVPRNVRVLLGTPLAHVLAACGHGEVASDARWRVGGPLSGFDVAGGAVPVTASVNRIALEPPRDPLPESPCIRCAACSDVCPVDLLPQELLRHARAGDGDALERHGLVACLECGCCDVVCPAAIPLTATFRHARDVRRDARAEARDAALAGERHRAREARLARREAGAGRGVSVPSSDLSPADGERGAARVDASTDTGARDVRCEDGTGVIDGAGEAGDSGDAITDPAAAALARARRRRARRGARRDDRGRTHGDTSGRRDDAAPE